MRHFHGWLPFSSPSPSRRQHASRQVLPGAVVLNLALLARAVNSETAAPAPAIVARLHHIAVQDANQDMERAILCRQRLVGCQKTGRVGEARDTHV